MCMRVRLLLIAACLVLPAAALAQKEGDWLPVTPADLQIKEVPGNPGAEAIQLYSADLIDDQAADEFVYKRIKILNDKGRDKYSDVEIPYPPVFSIHDLKARTIHPDGSIIEFTGKPFEKTLLKGKFDGINFKISAKTFAMPEVTVGSIIEYKYRVNTNGFIRENEWVVQSDLFTVKEDFSMKPQNFRRLSYTIQGLNESPVQKNFVVSLTQKDVPAFQSEELMPPADNYRSLVRFYYGGREIASIDKFWTEYGKLWYSEAEHFIGDHSEIKAAVLEVLGTETDPEKKLRKLYARAQQIRNLTFERERTEAETKKEKLKDNQNAADVLQRGFGYENEITRLFVAMARAAGFNASIVKVSNRRDRFFQKAFLEARELSAEIADVNLNGREVLLQPGVRFCPFGLLLWYYTDTDGLKLDKDGGVFIVVPAASYEFAASQRVADVTLAQDGALQGNVKVQYAGQEALKRRIAALFTDEAGKKKDLEEELKKSLPDGSVVNLTSVDNWEATEDPLVAHFTLQIQNFASPAGKRLLTPTALFRVQDRNTFSHPQRKYPVYFHHTFSEYDRVNITLPAGIAVDSVPDRQDVKAAFGAYQALTQTSGPLLVSQRVLLFNAILIPPERYAELKDFFNKIQAGDELQTVLHAGGPANAQKSN